MLSSSKAAVFWWQQPLLLLLLSLTATSLARDSGFLEESRFADFRFLVEPSDVTLERNGHVAILDCQASAGDSYPTPSVKWKRDGVTLKFPDYNDQRRLLSNGSLYISSVDSRSDQGLYQCVVTVSGIGTMVSRTARLQVSDSPQFEVEPSDVMVGIGQLAAFECRIKEEVIWMKDEQPLLLDHRMKILPSGLLEISDVKISDHGHYRCNVETKQSRAAVLKLKLDGGKEQQSAPLFLATPRNTKVLRGSEVTLDCAANGSPMPEILWLKDGSSIDLNHLDSRFTKVGSGSLNIKAIQREDAGTYQCRAENSMDSIDVAAVIEVIQAPTFIARPKNTIAVEKGDIELDCEVEASPEATVQWYKNGDLIIESEYFQLVRGSHLKILGLVGHDAGIYQCVATNLVGNIQSAATLKVIKKLVQAEVLSMKSLLKMPADQAHDSSSSSNLLSNFESYRDTPSAPLDLKAAIVSSRFVTLTWSPPQTSKDPLNGYSIYYKQSGSDRERVVNSTRGNLEEINIQGLNPGTSYIFRAVARNRHGAGESSEPLQILTQAELDVPGPVVNLEAKATTSFSILVSWNPPKHTNGAMTEYKLYYRQGDFNIPTQSQMLSADSKQYHVTQLREFTEYTFWVSAFNANGEGALSEEITCMTFSDIPADPPQNVSLEAASSSSLIVRWEPPPKESQNGIITGYKIRWRPRGKGHSEILTTDGSRRLYAVTGLKKDQDYQIKVAAMTVNGTGPATPWISHRTLLADLDESVVPDPPSSIRARSTDTEITIAWLPPRHNRIMVRGYTIGWGKGIPDEYTQVVDDKHRDFVIANLKPNSEYVISLRAYNNIGDGRPIYETVRTKEKSFDLEPAVPLIPPVGLHAIVLSSSAVVLTWMDSTLPQNQLIPDSRYYVVRYTRVNQAAILNSEEDEELRHSYRNATDLNLMIDDLRPATEYEFAVKVIRGRRESMWSLVVNNRTREAAPASAPRDIRIMPAGPHSLHLSWKQPKFTNGHINGYVIQYTTNRRADDRDWFVEAVVGDGTMATIRNLNPDTKYYFKMSARNTKGYGPLGQVVAFTTAPRAAISPTTTIGDSRSSLMDHSSGGGGSSHDKDYSPIVLYAVFGVGAGIILVLVVGVVVVLKYKCQSAPANDPRSNKSYHVAEAATNGTRDKLNPPPPDLWIGHDQLELKDISDEASAICDETGETTLTRSTPDYRATMERTRNYVQNSQYSGTESEVSFSLLNRSQASAGNHRLVISPVNGCGGGIKPVKIAAISGKPRVQRYLSRESVSSSIANGSTASSSTYIRSQYNLNPPPSLTLLSNPNNSMLSERLMDLSMTSPDDLPPLPGYDPSLTCTAPSDGPPSTIGDPDVSHSGTGSVLGISASGAIPAQPPQVPPTYLSSAMSTSSGDSSSNATASNNSHHGHHNLNIRRQSAGSQASSTHLRSFSSNPAANQTKTSLGHPTSPFKKPMMGNLNNQILGISSNGSDSGSSMATTSSGSSGSTSLKRPPSITDSPFQSGHLPTIADVRSPDVLHPQEGPCDCLSHPMRHSLSTEELNAEMKNLEGLMKDLNSMSPMAAVNCHQNATGGASQNC